MIATQKDRLLETVSLPAEVDTNPIDPTAVVFGNFGLEVGMKIYCPEIPGFEYQPSEPPVFARVVSIEANAITIERDQDR